MGDVQIGQERVGSLGPLTHRQSPGLQDGEDVLFDGQLAEDGRLLGKEADAAAGTLVNG